jgi:hypothetical protein
VLVKIIGMEKPKLETTSTDIVAAAARGVAAACPIIGGLISEAVNQIIPRQKLDRVIDYLQILEADVSQLKDGLNQVEKHLKDDHGLDLFEESLVQASHAVTKERRSRIANLMAKSLSQEDLKYAESKKMLNLLRELTDPELIMLIFYSKPITMGSVYHEQLRERHPEILKPTSRERGIVQEEIDRGALQHSYNNTLIWLGLLEEGSLELTVLGKLLLRYIENPKEEGAGN